MKSKEALDKLYDACDDEVLYELGVISRYEVFGIIEKDLERLEKLEDDKLELVIKNKQQDMFITKLIQENTKLKQAIEILKNYISVSSIGELYSFGASYRLTERDFRLIKEVLHNE